MRQQRTPRGAALEIVLVAPVLLLLLCGVVDTGRALDAQLTLTRAAHAGAEVWALGGTENQTRAQVRATAAGLSPTTVTITDCTAGRPTTVTVRARFSYLTPLVADLAPRLSWLEATGVRRCGG